PGTPGGPAAGAAAAWGGGAASSSRATAPGAPRAAATGARLRKVEALTTQLLDECGSLPLDVKPDAVAAIASKFVERLQPEHLAKIAEQFADAVARDAAADGGEAWERGAHGQEEDVVVIAEDDAEDAGELRKGEGHDDGARGFEATQELIDKMQ
ncbi:unnamed protein product, partial [Prorocentrum cordatum]